MPTSSDANIALNRFGYGARPDETPPGDPKRWLTAQFDRYEPRPAALGAVPTRAAVAGELADFYQMLRGPNGLRAQKKENAAATPDPTMAGTKGAAPAASAASDEPDPVKQARRFAGQQARDAYSGSVGARASITLTTPAPFVERLVHFWANHFAISIDKLQVIGLGGLLEFEAIRPNVLGKFSDMVLAVERHPAMLLYLDQAQSVGPNSVLGSRAGRFNAQRPDQQRKIGLNENLAREIMELHTLGVRSGYTQADVTEFARALTGWTVAGLGRGGGGRYALPGNPGDFAFAEALHEPGERTIVGRKYTQDGEKQGEAVLRDLSVHPATAHHIATKLARHFAGDDPPPALVARLEAAFNTSSGDLPTVYRALIAAPEAWVATDVKFKTPWEWSMSTMRALGYREAPALPTVGLLNQLGQPVWKPGAPAGWDDIAASWAGPDAVMRRVEAAERFASRASAVDARALAPKLYPGGVSDLTAQQLARAESPGQALALLLVAPEAMRR